jgi:hypothetical protein
MVAGRPVRKGYGVMRVVPLYILLVSLALQGWIAGDTESFAEVFGNPATAQSIAFSWILFCVLGVVEALIFIIWLTDVDHDIDVNERDIEHNEDKAITGIGVSIRDERAGALERLVSAFRVRLRMLFRVQNGSVSPIASLAGLLLAVGALIGLWYILN